MDLNIGAALWLAARGEGRLLLAGGGADAAGTEGRLAEQRQQEQRQAGQQPPLPLQQQQQHRSPARPSEAPSLEAPSPVYRSAARVVLLGHGADELCAGYGRHRTVFRARGWAGLGEELALDLRRLWLRNLGRDDRLVADHGRCGVPASAAGGGGGGWGAWPGGLQLDLRRLWLCTCLGWRAGRRVWRGWNRREPPPL